jgi:hypothetical protein
MPKELFCYCLPGAPTAAEFVRQLSKLNSN